MITTTVKNKIIRHALWRGTIFSAFGIFILAYCLIFLDSEILGDVGLFAYLSGSGLIAYGLIPYRTLSRLQLFPNCFVIDEKSICYFQNNRPILSFPRSAIAHIDYVADDTRYGIDIFFQDIQSLTVFDRRGCRSLRNKNKGNHVLFFPFFTQKALTLK